MVTIADSMSRDRRRSPRYAFVATAEITVEGSTSVIATRLGDLSEHGCYLCTANLPDGASIIIRISAGKNVFQASGKVVYCRPDGGIGVEFQQIEPRCATVLEEWLLEAKTLTLDKLF
jgi:PilZ domain